jgi:hypothetical protein
MVHAGATPLPDLASSPAQARTAASSCATSREQNPAPHAQTFLRALDIEITFIHPVAE